LKIVKLYKPTKHHILSLSRQIDSKNGEKHPQNFPQSRETATFTLKHLLALLYFLHNQSFPQPQKPFPKPPKTWKKDKKMGNTWGNTGKTKTNTES
jgi:hypothetical protein